MSDNARAAKYADRLIHVCDAATTLAEALSTTRQHRVRHLQDGRVVGLVTDRDLRLAMPPSGRTSTTS